MSAAIQADSMKERNKLFQILEKKSKLNENSQSKHSQRGGCPPKNTFSRGIC